MKNKLLIIGASGHGKVVADVALKMNRWKSIAFLDDNNTIKTLMSFEVIGTSKNLFKYIDYYEIFVGIGNNATRHKIIKTLETYGASIPTLIHPKAIIGSHVDIGVGTVVMAGVIINACTKIGKGCIVNTSATIDHDNEIEDFVHISPGVHLAGTVKVGKGSWLGIGSTVINDITITSDCKIGAGAVVVKNLLESGIYIGIPAKKVN